MSQPTLFESSRSPGAIDPEQLVLIALGEFQERGKRLAERELPLDRLRGALRRAAESYGIAQLDDEQAVAALQSLGASVRRVPSFVAKHPYRVTVPTELAERSRLFFQQLKSAVPP
jgi:hypothetical protein